ncbi:hypothetical protein [Sphingopyxis sp.]|uniref:hypothetical protein n=1 Tax=Sphingopyxis sp. TaxID=1908224 RepID=UPI002B4AA32C|nr:hypothetical protein [Sphingopyxis sp.]HJS13165.1 hypothetical protein [Sphingopyxis sp.]
MSVQITAYIAKEEAEQFHLYAASLGIDKSSLANLLIKRELLLDRLGDLGKYRHDVPRAQCMKITAHVADQSTKTAFEAAAQRHKLRPGIAASILFRAELSEIWLKQSLSHLDSD